MRELICAVMTKFGDDGKLVLDSRYEEFLSALSNSGVDTFMVAGTNGEFYAMTLEERKLLLEFVVSNFKGKVDIIAHIGTTNLRDTLILGEHALELGVKRLSVVAPYYLRYDPGSIIHYFKEVSENLEEAEIMLYNIPAFSGNRITEDQIVDTAESSNNIVGIKDSDIRPWIVPDLKKKLKDSFKVFGGIDTVVVDYLAMGSDGQVSGTANVFPKLLRSLLDEFDSGDYENAFKHQITLQKVVRNVSGHGSFLWTNRYALKILGYDLGFPRSPVKSLDEDEKDMIREFVKRVREWSI